MTTPDVPDVFADSQAVRDVDEHLQRRLRRIRMVLLATDRWGHPEIDDVMDAVTAALYLDDLDRAFQQRTGHL